MFIHTLGDSHSEKGWSEFITKHHIGPKLCYSIGIDKQIFHLQSFCNNNDIIIFCFGEIDCRYHIHKHITENLSYQNIIDNIIINYFDTIRLNIVSSNVKFNKICVFNVVPPIINDGSIDVNIDLPYLGSDNERKKYVLYFNSKIKEFCLKFNYLFFDVYDKYTDENGFLNKELSDNNVHIGNGIFLDHFILNNLL